MRSTCPVYHIILNLIALKIFHSTSLQFQSQLSWTDRGVKFPTSCSIITVFITFNFLATYGWPKVKVKLREGA
jgi:hypothetical protein